MALSGHGANKRKTQFTARHQVPCASEESENSRAECRFQQIYICELGSDSPPGLFTLKTLFIVYVTFHYIITSVNSARTPPEDDFNDLRKADRADCQFPGETSEPDHTIGAIAFRCKFCNPQNSFKK